MQQPQSSPVDLMIAQKQEIQSKSIRFSDPHHFVKLSLFFFLFFLHPVAAARRIQNSKCHSDERNADDKAPIIVLGCAMGIL
jgi:hypothetical protein